MKKGKNVRFVDVYSGYDNLKIGEIYEVEDIESRLLYDLLTLKGIEGQYKSIHFTRTRNINKVNVTV